MITVTESTKYSKESTILKSYEWVLGFFKIIFHEIFTEFKKIYLQTLKENTN